MFSSITASSAAAAHGLAGAVPPRSSAAPAKPAGRAPAAQPPAASAAASKSQQQAALTRLLAKYSYDQSRGTNAGTLSALAKQIVAAAKALGQHVTLPRAATPAGTATTAGRVNITA